MDIGWRVDASNVGEDYGRRRMTREHRSASRRGRQVIGRRERHGRLGAVPINARRSDHQPYNCARLLPIDRIEPQVAHLNLLTLMHGVHAGVQIRPRWPARHVHVDERVLGKLQAIQAELPAELDLILTRGYEPPTSGLGHARRRFRALGIGMFRVLYPDRRNELADIFGSNGHDIDGTHIDVSFSLNGRRVRMLPLGVFTPPFWQRRRMRRCAPALAQINSALIRQGFRIHSNPTESLQIHCDLTC
ncbi:hypothetical protein [Burkholderia stagnalis]|uniref:hypothetical protein n=1 Tax=Burkholderia stagnalis TaxID=1503054 RepID=UPI001E30B282|nr:hypothetical protein [Burkholderia stagnalis]